MSRKTKSAEWRHFVQPHCGMGAGTAEISVCRRSRRRWQQDRGAQALRAWRWPVRAPPELQSRCWPTRQSTLWCVKRHSSGGMAGRQRRAPLRRRRRRCRRRCRLPAACRLHIHHGRVNAAPPASPLAMYGASWEPGTRTTMWALMLAEHSLSLIPPAILLSTAAAAAPTPIAAGPAKRAHSGGSVQPSNCYWHSAGRTGTHADASCLQFKLATTPQACPQHNAGYGAAKEAATPDPPHI